MSQTTRFAVEGRWPFPLDMLRRSSARPATIADRDKIERLSADHVESREQLRERVRIDLVVPFTGRMADPNREMWEHNDWPVVDDEPTYAATRTDTEVGLRPLYEAAMAKLTPGERKALDWFRPYRRT